MFTQKMRALSYIWAEKITFPPKPDIQTDIHTYRRTDISVNRVASLLKRIVADFFHFRMSSLEIIDMPLCSVSLNI